MTDSDASAVVQEKTVYKICGHHLLGHSRKPEGTEPFPCSGCISDGKNKECGRFLDGEVYIDRNGKLRAEYKSRINGAEAVIHLPSFWVPTEKPGEFELFYIE